jgi:CreA protein
MITMRMTTAALCLVFASAGACAETIGSVDTAFKLRGPVHKVVGDVCVDP